MMGTSWRISCGATTSGAMIADRPRMNSTLKMLLPTTLPSAMSTWPPHAERTETASSGALVPKATMVRPNTSGEMPNDKASFEAPRIRICVRQRTMRSDQRDGVQDEAEGQKEWWAANLRSDIEVIDAKLGNGVEEPIGQTGIHPCNRQIRWMIFTVGSRRRLWLMLRPRQQPVEEAPAQRGRRSAHPRSPAARRAVPPAPTFRWRKAAGRCAR
jgi:hypothetical protein